MRAHLHAARSDARRRGLASGENVRLTYVEGRRGQRTRRRGQMSCQRTVAGPWQDRADQSCRTGPRLAPGSLGGGGKKGVQVGFPGWDTIRRMYDRGEWRALAAAGRWLSGAPAGSRTAVGQWDGAGLSWT